MTYTTSDVPIEHHPYVAYKICTVQCSVQCYCVQCAVCSVQCAVYSALCAVHSAHYTPDPDNNYYYCPGLAYSVINRKCITYRTSCNNQQQLN